MRLHSSFLLASSVPHVPRSRCNAKRRRPIYYYSTRVVRLQCILFTGRHGQGRAEGACVAHSRTVRDEVPDLMLRGMRPKVLLDRSMVQAAQGFLPARLMRTEKRERILCARSIGASMSKINLDHTLHIQRCCVRGFCKMFFTTLYIL
jgi:hypothetical protein